MVKGLIYWFIIHIQPAQKTWWNPIRRFKYWTHGKPNILNNKVRISRFLYAFVYVFFYWKVLHIHTKRLQSQNNENCSLTIKWEIHNNRKKCLWLVQQVSHNTTSGEKNLSTITPIIQASNKFHTSPLFTEMLVRDGTNKL